MGEFIMKNIEVVELFVSGTQNHKGTKNLHIENGKLISYYTVIGQWMGNSILVNDTKYSQSTSVIQNKLRYLAGSYYETNVYVPQGTNDLLKYLESKEVAE